MKRYKNLYPKIYAYASLMMAWRKASKGKRYKNSTADFAMNLDEEIVKLHQELRDGTYMPSGYTHFTVHDPKRRKISAAAFRDRVVHHALVGEIQPIYERKFIDDTYANRVGKGTHKALDRCTEFMQKFKYVLPCDVQRFFPAIDHQILKDILAKTIADEAVLRLCGKIIDSGAGVLTEQYAMRYFDGDDLLAVNRPRGLPIGNLTSQFWANVYLNEFDHFVKRQLKCKGYIRYVDDFVLFSDDKKQLHDWRDAIIAYLVGLRLTIHENRCQPRPVTQGVTFLGFTAYPTHRRLKRIKGLAYQRRLRAVYKAYLRGEITAEEGRASVMSWLGHVRHGNTRGLVRKMFAEVKRVTIADIHENRSINGVVIGTHG